MIGPSVVELRGVRPLFAAMQVPQSHTYAIGTAGSTWLSELSVL